MNDMQHAPHRGVLILVLGILGVVGICPILGPVAWIMGRADMAVIDAGRMDPEGRGLTQAGMICGIISTAIMILLLLGIVLFLGFALIAGASTSMITAPMPIPAAPAPAAIPYFLGLALVAGASTAIS